MKRGIGIVGIIIAIVVLVLLLSLAGTVLAPEVQKVSSTAKQLVLGYNKTTENYYTIPYLTASKGYLEFEVFDPNNYIITDFRPLFGEYIITEDGIPRPAQDVAAFQSLTIAAVIDPGFGTDCRIVKDEIEGIKFNNTLIGFFPAGGFTNIINITDCQDTGGDYWTAIQNATASLPSEKNNYNMLLVISKGTCTSANCSVPDVIEQATSGLQRSDINSAWILTDKLNNCKDNEILNATNAILGVNLTGAQYISEDGKKLCTDFLPTTTTNLVEALKHNVATIKMHYTPIAKNGTHTIKLTVIKRPYAGSAENPGADYG